jgi:hypothetical protein
MRKILAIALGIIGLTLALAVPASANAGAGLAHKPALAADSGVTKVWYGHHHRHGGLGFGLYFGAPRYAYYPRYRYYNDYYYDRPRYSYYSYSSPRRHRHWCGRHDRWEW